MTKEKLHFPRGTKIRASCDVEDRIIQYNYINAGQLRWNETKDHNTITNSWDIHKIKVISKLNKVYQIY